MSGRETGKSGALRMPHVEAARFVDYLRSARVPENCVEAVRTAVNKAIAAIPEERRASSSQQIRAAVTEGEDE
jgi:hypothetical protein